MREEHAEEFSGALAQVLEGAVRLVDWAPQVGIPDALGLSADEWVERRLAGAVRLSIAERRQVVAANPDMSTRELGAALGVDQKTVANDRKALTPSEEFSSPEPENAGDIAAPSEEFSSPEPEVVSDDTPDVGPQDEPEAEAPTTADEQEPDDGPIKTPAEKDAERKARGAERREQLRDEDDAAPFQDAELHHGAFQGLAADLPDASGVLLLTDPPYGMDYRSGFRWASSHDRIEGDGTPDTATAALADALDALDAKLAPDAHLLTFCRWREEPEFRAVIERAGWTLRSSIVWVKNEPGMGDLRHSFGPAHERILHATRGSAQMRYRESDVLSSPRVVSARHPTEKPVEILRRLIRATTNPGDLVLDPFAGVGSSLVAAADIGRRAWGCEIDDGYHAQGVGRLAA